MSSLKYAAHRKLESHYDLGPVIGEGGFAKVRMGRCVVSKQMRAIKTMDKNIVNAKLFGTEIAIIKRVSHPNIVKTFDVYETNKYIHIVMEYMEGGMLYDAIEDGIRFEEEDVAQFMSELIDGILYLHRLGIVHRDMKPENVLCTNKEVPLHVKIADFGLSSITDLADQKANKMIMSTMTGTPEFVAPEMVNGKYYSEKVDIWALGMLCYNIVCGKLPIDEDREIFPQLRNGVDLKFAEPEWKCYSEKSKSFVRALLCTNPEKRLTALACLVHPWLDERELGLSNRVAQNGRVSKYLREKGPHISSLKSKKTFKPISTSDPMPSMFQSAQDVRKMWVIAYLMVSAVNRFDCIVHPHRYDRAQKVCQNYRRMVELSTTRESDISLNSSTIEKRSTKDGSDTEEEISSTSWTTGHIMNEKAQDRNGRDRERPPTSLRRGFAPTTTTKGVSQQLLTEDSPKKTRSFRKKFLAVISNETTKGLSAPVRKLSRRLAKKGEEKRGKNTEEISPAQLDLELGLDNFEIVDVDESDAISLDNAESRESAGPSSHNSKKQDFLLKMQRDIANAETSPTTPACKGFR